MSNAQSVTVVVKDSVSAVDVIALVTTVALVFVTVAYVIITHRLSRSAVHQAEAAQTMARAAYMPILVPEAVWPDDKNPAETYQVYFRLKNIGLGPAMNVEARLWTGSADLEGKLAPQGDWESLSPVAPGDTWPPDSDPDGFGTLSIVDEDIREVWPALEHHDEWSVEVRFAAITGAQYVVRNEPHFAGWSMEALDDENVTVIGRRGQA